MPSFRLRALNSELLGKLNNLFNGISSACQSLPKSVLCWKITFFAVGYLIKMPVVVSEIFSTVLLMDCELFEEIAVKIIYTHLHILLIFFMKADPALSACKHSWSFLSYVTHEATKALTLCFSTCILIFLNWAFWNGCSGCRTSHLWGNPSLWWRFLDTFIEKANS